MTTNSLVSLDLSVSSDLPKVAAPVRPAERSRPTGRRTIAGGCLLQFPRALWMAVDVSLVWCGTALGDQLFVWWDDPTTLLTTYNLWVSNVVLGSAVVLAGGVFGFYESSTLWARSRIVARGLMTVTLAMLATWLVMHLFMYSSLSRRVAVSGTVFFLLTASTLRLVAHRAVRDVCRGLLVIGQGPLTGSIVRSVRRGSVPGYRLVGLVMADLRENTDHWLSDIPVVGGIDRIEGICREYQVAEVVVSDAASMDPRLQRAALACLRLGCRVTDEITFYESTYGEVPVSHITPGWFLSADLKGQRQEHAVIKRVFDVVVAAIGLMVSMPIILLVSLLVWVEGRGPVFYSQTRVGQGGRRFTLYKFRTMVGNAEADGTVWAKPNDPRVTPIGRLLRRLRMDELPQLLNILKGDMSVVGPRPERPEFVGPLAALLPFYDERHLIKPGLTGWAQINYSYGSTVNDAQRKLQLDLYYVKHTSLELDLIILLRTFGTFFLGSR